MIRGGSETTYHEILYDTKTRDARLSPPRKVYQLCLEGCRARMKTEVVKMPAGAVKSCGVSKVAALACMEKCGRRGLKGILYRFVFRCKTWFKTQHPYRKGRNSSACSGFRDIDTEVFFQHRVSGRAQRRAKMCKTTRWRKVDFHLLEQSLT